MEHRHIKIAVIGRPNVGKSTLFNRLIGERKAIVDDTPGVTRDRLYADILWNSKDITLIDTGGLVYNSEMKNEIIQGVRKQVFFAIEESDFVIFLLDGKSGITQQDEKIASYLRKIKNTKKIFLAVNKIDTEKQIDLIYEFYSLGFGDPHPISALSGSSGLADIFDEIVSYKTNVNVVETPRQGVSTEDAIKIAIVGKPNVGKSSILNCLAGEERSLVTSVPGTTRDSVDSKVKVSGKEYILIDTAGLRRKSKVSSRIERYANIRVVSSIERADVVLFVVDVTSEITDQDQKIASLIKRRNKPSIILANKWDLIKDKNIRVVSSIQEGMFSSLHFVNYSMLLFTSVFERKSLNKIWPLINSVYSNYEGRISTSKLNKALEDITLQSSMPTKNGKELKIYYVTQSNIKPPEIVFFINDSKIVTKQYERFLEKEIRSRFDFLGTPIKLVFRSKKKE